MRVVRSLVLMSLAAALAAGCNRDFNPTTPTGALTEPQSFTVHGGFNTDLSTNPVDFVLRVDPVAGSMIVGTAGSAASVPFVSSDGVSFRAQGSVTLPIPNTGCGSAAMFSAFQFTAGTDSISGTATGAGYILQGDYGLSKPARLDFKGVPDVTPPSIVSQGALVDPLAALVVFTASEPLPSSAQAQLFSPNDQIALSQLSGDGSTTVGFQKSAGALRYDTTYKIAIDHWADLAGNLGLTPDVVTTFSAPPLIPADGFESAPPTLGGATIADATTFPPISGQKSLLIGSSTPTTYPLPARFTARLAVAPGNTVVRFSVRQFTTSVMLYTDLFDTQARLAVPGGEIVNVPLGNFGTSGTDQITPSGMHIILGDVVEIEAPLPSGVADTVVFDFRTDAYDSSCSGAPIPASSYQIDDLRVE